MHRELGKREQTLGARPIPVKAAARQEPAEVAMLIIPFIVAHMRVVAGDVLVLIGELSPERGGNDLQQEIEGELSARVTKGEAVRGFVDQRARGMDRELAEQQRNQEDDQDVCLRDQPENRPMHGEHDYRRPGAPRIGARQRVYFRMRGQHFAPQLEVTPRLRRQPVRLGQDRPGPDRSSEARCGRRRVKADFRRHDFHLFGIIAAIRRVDTRGPCLSLKSLLNRVSAPRPNPAAVRNPLPSNVRNSSSPCAGRAPS
jgi:hypothetical protein